MIKTSKWLLPHIITLLVIAILASPISYAGTTGKIAGQITDKNSGDPVMSASVSVVGTKYGAVTNLEGRFQIPRLDPGTYTLRISHIEYNTIEVTDIIVKIDETNDIAYKMTTKITDTGTTITVKDVRDVIDVSVTGGQVSISQEAIRTRPVQTVDALLQQVAGVQTTAEGQVFIRGGRANEVGYIVDGVPIGDPLAGGGSIGASLSLVSGSIAEIQIIKDGFDPEYGNALSGIINIRSQTGSKDNTRFNFQYLTDDFGNSSLNKYSRNFDYMRFTLGGPDPILSEKILPSIGLNFMRDQEFTYYIYGDMDKNNGVYQLDDFDTAPTEKVWPNKNLFGFDVPERLFNRFTFQSNFRFRPQQNLKFVLSYKRWYIKRTSFDWVYALSNSTLPIDISDRQSISLEINQLISKDMSYEVILSVVDNQTSHKPGDPNNPGKTRDPDEFLFDSEWETFNDLNGNRVYDAPEPLINLFPDTAVYGIGFVGPGYTHGELDISYPNQSDPVLFRFNNNGRDDDLEGEPFLDLNGNGVWDAGDFLHDKNGNGILDNDRRQAVKSPTPEAFIDGDSIIGEPFTDLNANEVYDNGVDIFFIAVDPATNQDLNHNGKYDGPQNPWTPGIPFLDLNGNGIYDRPNRTYDPGEPFNDVNGNGVYDVGGATFIDNGTHDDNTYWEETSTRQIRGEVKLFRQVNRHDLKAGFSIQRDEVEYNRIDQPWLNYTGRPDTTNPFVGRGAFRDFYKYNPVRGTVYFRDKIEYGSMIASLGLRWDFFLQDTKELEKNLVADDRGGLIEGDKQKLSPRIGFSYPISDKAKVYFNYGHFFQLPSYTRFYARNTSSSNQDDVVGNPNLNYQKTIQYSFGIKYAMSESYSIDIEGYFKDEFDKINSGDVIEGSLIRQQYQNKDYGRSRGFEIEVEKRGGGYVTGTASYTYAFAFGKESKTKEQFELDLLSREPLTESPLNNDIRHTFKSGITVFMPSTVKPRLFGLPIPNGWSLSLETIIQSGTPFTPSSIFPNMELGQETPETNSMRLPWTAFFDARFSKNFKLAGLDWEWIFWVENIFDKRNVLFVYSDTGRPDTQQNINQIVREGTTFDSNPFNWGYGRQIRMGIELNI